MSTLRFFKPTLVATALLLGSAAHASLVYDAALNQSGQGFGAVKNILTFAAQGGQANSNDVTGGVGWDGSANTFFGVDPSGAVDTNIIKTNTWSFGELSVNTAAQIIVVWDPAEQNSTVAALNTVEMAVLSIYTDTGGLFWTSGNSNTSTTVDSGFSASSYASTINPGTGGNGFAYTLDTTQAASLQTALDGVAGGYSAYRIGLYAEHDSLDNGPDTWLIDSNPELPPGPNDVPAPGSVALLGIGMLGLGLTWLRRRRSN